MVVIPKALLPQSVAAPVTSIGTTTSVAPVEKRSFVLPAPKVASGKLDAKFDPSWFKTTPPMAAPSAPDDSEAPKMPTDIGQTTASVTAAVDLTSVTNANFIAAVFGNLLNGASAVVCSKSGDPALGGWMPMPAAKVHGCAANMNNYFNCATFMAASDGTYHARKDSAVAFHCLVLDDVGTKVARNGLGGVTPSWVLETSPGNYQVGFILVSPLTIADDVARLQNAAIAAGLCDPGANGMTRWVRLPVGINGKPKYKTSEGKRFQCRLTEWHPEVRYTVDELVVGLKLKMDAAPTGLSVEPHDTASAEVATGNTKSFVPTEMSKLAQLLDAIKPDCGRNEWLHVLMAVHNATGGSDAGLALVDAWSSKGKKYKGPKDVAVQWHSLDGYTGTPIAVGTLIKMAREVGADTDAIMMGEEAFEPCETEVVEADAQAPATTTMPRDARIANPLTRYSLRDSLAELEKQRVEQRLILGELVLLGQATVIYALANTGKTLIVIYLLIDAIRKSLIDPSKLYYINMDDNSSGLVEKVRVFAEYGCHMLADGHKGFAAKVFSAAMQKMIETDTAHGAIIVLDTLKKFVNTMNKDESREFAGVVRRFCLKGGTVIALAHANKNPGPDGKIKYTGTTDIVDDFDCAYTLQTVSQVDATQRVVEFTNIKRRGDVALSAAYSYALERGVSYGELLTSVQELNLDQLEPIKQAAELQSDAPVITAIESCIAEGITSKMKLAMEAAERAKVSNRVAIQVLEKYTGDDQNKHRWKYVVRDRGAKVFELLSRPAEPTAAPGEATL